jgi:hypothetical protein
VVLSGAPSGYAGPSIVPPTNRRVISDFASNLAPVGRSCGVWAAVVSNALRIAANDIIDRFAIGVLCLSKNMLIAHRAMSANGATADRQVRYRADRRREWQRLVAIHPSALRRKVIESSAHLWHALPMRSHALLPLALVALIGSGCSKTTETERACTSPRVHWQHPHFTGGLDRPRFSIDIDHDGIIYADGDRLSLAKLAEPLGTIGKLDDPTPDVVLQTEMGAPCDTVEAVRELMDRKLNCKKSDMCAEGIMSLWRRWPIPKGTLPS